MWQRVIRKLSGGGRPVQEVPPYTRLAPLYDDVMAHVDYRKWSELIYHFIRQHRPSARRILELGCGTASLGLLLQPKGDFTYIATDGSQAMVDEARRKAGEQDIQLTFQVASFADFEVDEAVDVVLLVYDGLNYLLELQEVRAVLARMEQALKPGGIAILDHTTPANSEIHEERFSYEGESGAGRFVRRSEYDAAERVHTTEIEIEEGGEVYLERHRQRIYTYREIKKVIQESPLVLEQGYHEFTLAPAAPESHRIHWVARRPADVQD